MNKIKKYLTLQFYSEGDDSRSLTRIYIFALSSIALITIFFQVIRFTKQIEVSDTIGDIRQIERHAGRLEKVYEQIVESQIATNKPFFALPKIYESLVKLDVRHRKIVNSSGVIYCEINNCTRFFDKNYFSNQAKLFRESKLSDTLALEKALEEVKAYQGFLIILNNFHENNIRYLSQNLIFLDLLFLALIILILFIQAIYGFRPAIRKLDEALSVRSDFISRISHEIRNPMNSIMGMADILKSTNLSSEQGLYVTNLQRSSRVLLEMLNNLVDFSSSSRSKKIVLESTFFDLKGLIDQVTDVFAVQAHEKGLEVFIQVDPDIPELISTDKLRLEQVLFNLFNNALKFTEKGYVKIKVNLEEKKEKTVSLRFLVEDTGIGVSMNKINDIFKSFVQEDSSIKRKFGGSGLGLSICKQIVGLMGSNIVVESKKGEGSKFYFDLDLEYEDHKNETNIYHLGKTNILFLSGMQNDEPMREYLEAFCESYRIFKKVKDLREYLQKSKKTFEVVVDDSIGIISMAKISEFVSKKRLYALMRSNFPKENMDILQQNGYSQFLIKPFRKWHLDKRGNSLDSWLDNNNIQGSQLLGLEKSIKKEKLKVLAVDDSNDNLFLMKEVLSPVTSLIDFANDGSEACEQIEVKDYDIVFMDIQMPIMDGYTAIRKIRATNKKTPIYAVTAHAGVVEENKCLEAGFNGRITKPISRNVLLGIIKDTFDLKANLSEEGNSGLEKRMIEKLLPSYFEARDEDLKSMKAALEAKDFDLLKRMGHKVQGSAKSYGFSKVGELGKKLEFAAGSNDLKSCKEYVKNIDECLEKAKTSPDLSL